MKKLITKLLVVGLMVACLTSSAVYGKTSSKTKKQYCKVSVSKVKSSKKRVLVKVKIKNTSKNRTIFYGDSFELEEKIGKQWKKVEWTKEVSWIELAYGVPHGGSDKKTYVILKNTLNTDFKKNKKYRIKMGVFTEKDKVKHPEKTRTEEIKYINFKIK
ncbi:MAG: hypothetical protein E7254_04820 [Lachnospiraceae bacterium]|nr:hypothetical protein [Lachnospiraceae bacterium]